MAKRESVKARIERCVEAVEERPDSPVAHYNLGLAYTKSGRMELAENSYLKALELDPDMIEAWVNLGGVRLHRWDFEGCLEACREAIQRDDRLLIAHYNLGQACLYMGDAEGVVKANEKVLEMDRDHAAAHYHMAVGLLALKELGAAQRHLGRAMELGHRPTPEFMKALGKSRKVQGRRCTAGDHGDRLNNGEQCSHETSRRMRAWHYSNMAISPSRSTKMASCRSRTSGTRTLLLRWQRPRASRS